VSEKLYSREVAGLVLSILRVHVQLGVDTILIHHLLTGGWLNKYPIGVPLEL